MIESFNRGIMKFMLNPFAMMTFCILMSFIELLFILSSQHWANAAFHSLAFLVQFLFTGHFGYAALQRSRANEEMIYHPRLLRRLVSCVYLLAWPPMAFTLIALGIYATNGQSFKRDVNAVRMLLVTRLYKVMYP